MGRQQGGEDFYFLQKVFAFGKVKELEQLHVYPMARFSDRIPFGTGPALQKIADEPDGEMKSYHFDAFLALKELFDLRHAFFKQDGSVIREKIGQLHPAIVEFTRRYDVVQEIEECNRNSATQPAFEKRFFHHFNASRSSSTSILSTLPSSSPEHYPCKWRNRSVHFENWLFFNNFAPV
jgi:hypothetical protein